ncbi:MAG: glucosaminidase domain-containing protein [Pseudomonadales bacterium]|nr:glucosaminidase domain-containing protein [Pseudomonadales bacterium]
MPNNFILSGLLLMSAVFGIGKGYLLWKEPSLSLMSSEVEAKSITTSDETPMTQTPNLSASKQRFIQTLMPLIEQENERILGVRSRLLLLRKTASLTDKNRTFLKILAEEYRVRGAGLDEQKLVAELLFHVDVLPVDLVLAQAAMETGWGASRFATEANNYFGQWCFQRGCGLVPKNRADDKKHEVRRFVNPAESVQSYMKNINSHPAYRALRELRRQYREQGEVLSGEGLAGGLKSYSQMGENYVLVIRSIIKNNGLNRLSLAI